MNIYKHKIFNKWAASEGLGNDVLIKAIDEMNKGLCEVNLGGGLYKKRVGMRDKGKRGSYRTLIAFMENEKAFFIYGFSKNEKSDISDHEKEVYKKLARVFLSMKDVEVKDLLATKNYVR